MESFKEYFNQELFVEEVTRAFDTPYHVASKGAYEKPWSGTKKEVLKIWQDLRTNLPIYITPMDDAAHGSIKKSSYDDDGVRVTGSWQFIISIMGRLKELLAYENPETKLRLIFKGIDPSRRPNPMKQTYAFYVNLQKRKTPKRRTNI